MTYQFDVRMAWGGGDFINRNYENGDQLNQLHILAGIDSSSALNEVLVSPTTNAEYTLVKDFTEYGSWRWDVLAEAANTFAGINLLTDGTNHQINTNGVSTYYFVFWIKGLDFTGGQEIRCTLREGATVRDTVDTVVDGTWQQVQLSYATASPSTLDVRVQKNGIASDRNFQITGLYVLASTVAVTIPDYYNNGSAYLEYEDVSSYLRYADWFLGATVPFQQVSDERNATVELYNENGLFTPIVSSELGTNIRPGRWVEIGYYNDTAFTCMWRGFIDGITVQGERGSATEEIYTKFACRGDKQDLDQRNISDAFKSLNLFSNAKETMLLNFTADTYLEDICEAVQFPYNLESGQTTLGRYGDDKELKIWQAVKELTEAEFNAFTFLGRGGTLNFFASNHAYTTMGTVDKRGTISGAYKPMPAGEFQPIYGGDYYSNQVIVEANPVTTGGTVTLADIAGTITVSPGASVSYTVRLRREEGQYAGASDLTKITETYASGTATVTVQESGGQAIITITNSGGVDAVLTRLTYEGAYITRQHSVFYTANDLDDQAIAGIRNPIEIDLMAFTDLDDLRTRAEDELARRALAWHLPSVTFYNDMDGTANAHQLSWTLGEVFSVNSPTHFGTALKDYVIKGEKHAIQGINKDHHTIYYLEPVFVG